MRPLFTAAVLAAAVAAPLPAQPASAPPLPDTLPLRAAVRGGQVAVDRPGMASLAAPGFRYLGGHRFVLYNVADAEQHLFVDAASDGTVRRLYWIQLEEFLPEQRHRTYDYGRDSVMYHGGLPWRVNARRWFASPPANSDGAAVIALLRARGLSVPEAAERVRMVYLPESERWREVMVIYVEADGAGGRPPAQLIIQKAFDGLVVGRGR